VTFVSIFEGAHIRRGNPVLEDTLGLRVGLQQHCNRVDGTLHASSLSVTAAWAHGSACERTC
jgi:hypothetical protein